MRNLQVLLQDDPEIELVATCDNGREAVASILEHRPDLVFLDVQMPEVDGIEVLRQVHEHYRPLVVFCTAYDRYALTAFELHAQDFLLKPFSDKRFRVAVDTAKQQLSRLSQEHLAARLQNLLDYFEAQGPTLFADTKPGAKQYFDRLPVRQDNDIVLVPVDEIIHLEAQGNYVLVVAETGRYLTRETLTGLLASLDPAEFVRIHRSMAVRQAAVRKVTREGRSGYAVELVHGKTLRVGKQYEHALEALLSRPARRSSSQPGDEGV